MTTDMKCEECRDTLGALIDGELLPAEAERVRAHIDQCGACAAEHRMLTRLSTLVSNGAGKPRAPDVLKARIRNALANPQATERAVTPSAMTRWKLLAAGLVIAAASAGGTYLAMRQPAAAAALEQQVLSSHIRSLMPGHLTDVASTNLHNVKPWFNGRIDMSPVVPLLDSAGFPLVGGRLDYVGGRSVAAVVYSRRQHLINVFSWPTGDPASPPAISSQQGYHLVRWVSDGVEYWAASDLGVPELTQFVSLFRRE
jgi:mycothiol system anti-sigma-R factor